MGILEAKVGIVTGASRGIGRAIAMLAAREGATVVVNYCSAADAGERSSAIATTLGEIAKTGGEAAAFDADVSKSAEVRAMVAFALERYGRLDFLVNNAGIQPVSGRDFLTLEEERWERVHQVNLKGVFLCTQAAARSMVERKSGGRIVSISSISAIVGGGGQTHYSAAKAGVAAFMRSAAIALGPHRITCNSIMPGAIDTDMLRDGQSAEKRASWIPKTPVRRLGEPEDIANAAVFLLSDRSGFITGASLVVDGGLIINLQ